MITAVIESKHGNCFYVYELLTFVITEMRFWFLL